MCILKSKYGFQNPNVGFDSKPICGFQNPHAGSHIYCLSTHIYCFSAHIYIFKFMPIFWKLYKTHICVSKPTFMFQNPHLCFKMHIYTSWIRVLNPVLKAKIWFCRNVNVGFKTQMWVLKPTFTFQNPDFKTSPTDVVRYWFCDIGTWTHKIFENWILCFYLTRNFFLRVWYIIFLSKIQVINDLISRFWVIYS